MVARKSIDKSSYLSSDESRRPRLTIPGHFFAQTTIATRDENLKKELGAKNFIENSYSGLIIDQNKSFCDKFKSKTPINYETNSNSIFSTRDFAEESNLLLIDSIKNQELENEKEVKSKINVNQCICQSNVKDHDSIMIQCDYCDIWFHIECVNISASRAHAMNIYKCPYCSSKKQNHPKGNQWKNLKSYEIISKYLNGFDVMKSGSEILCNCKIMSIIKIEIEKKIQQKSSIQHLLNKLDEDEENIEKDFTQIDNNLLQNSYLNQKKIPTQNLNIPTNDTLITQSNNLIENYHICRICCQQIVSSRIQHHIRKCAIKTNANYQVPYELVDPEVFKSVFSTKITPNSIYCSQNLKKHNENFGCEGFRLICGHHAAPTNITNMQQALNFNDNHDFPKESNKNAYNDSKAVFSSNCQYISSNFDSIIHNHKSKINDSCHINTEHCDRHYDWRNILKCRINKNKAKYLNKLLQIEDKIQQLNQKFSNHIICHNFLNQCKESKKFDIFKNFHIEL